MAGGLEWKNPDWVKASGSPGSGVEDAMADKKEIEEAQASMEADPVLRDDEYARRVVANGDRVFVEKTGQTVVVDLKKFLTARSHFLQFEQVKTLDYVLAQIAAGAPDLEAFGIRTTLH